jgi:hypothetical protein
VWSTLTGRIQHYGPVRRIEHDRRRNEILSCEACGKDIVSGCYLPTLFVGYIVTKHSAAGGTIARQGGKSLFPEHCACTVDLSSLHRGIAHGGGRGMCGAAARGFKIVDGKMRPSRRSHGGCNQFNELAREFSNQKIHGK